MKKKLKISEKRRYKEETSENLSSQKYSNKIENLIGPNSRMERSKKGIHELEGKIIEMMNLNNGEKRDHKRKKEQNFSGTHEIITKDLRFLSSESQRGEDRRLWKSTQRNDCWKLPKFGKNWETHRFKKLREFQIGYIKRNLHHDSLWSSIRKLTINNFESNEREMPLFQRGKTVSKTVDPSQKSWRPEWSSTFFRSWKKITVHSPSREVIFQEGKSRHS